MKKLIPVVIAVFLLAVSLVVVSQAAPPEEASIAPASPSQDVTVSIEPQVSVVNVGDIFSVALHLDSGAIPIDSVQFYVDFVTDCLQVNNLVGSGAFGTEFVVNWDNAAGHVDYAAGNFVPPFPSGSFDAAYVYFTANCDTETVLTWNTVVPRQTKANSGGVAQDLALISGTVRIVRPYSLTVNVDPTGSGSVIKTPDQVTYTYGTVVTLDPEPSGPCWSFDHWSGDLTGSDDPATITMTKDMVITAHFVAPTYTLTVNVVGNGTVDKAPDKAAYDCGEDVILTANPAANARFVEWSGPDAPADPTENPTTVYMDADKSLTATFVDTHTVTVGPSVPPEGGTVTVVDENDDGYYDDGETITITVQVADCYEFTGWTGDLEIYGTQETVVIVLDSDLSFAATFQLTTHSLTVNIDDPDEVGGAVTLEPPGGVYSCCTVITLTAAPADRFKDWRGALTGATNPITIHIDSDKVVTATFIGKVTVTFDPPPVNGEIVLDPEQPPEGYDPGTVITVTAVPDYCYKFDGWTGDLEEYGTQETVVITITEDLSFSAEFSLRTYTLAVSVDPEGKGYVILDPDLAVYDCGTTITATAVVSETTWVFDYWSGALTSSDSTDSFVIDDVSKTVLTAHFKQYKIFLPLVAKNYGS